MAYLRAKDGIDDLQPPLWGVAAGPWPPGGYVTFACGGNVA